MRLFTKTTFSKVERSALMVGVFMAIGGSAMAEGNDFCLTGTISSEQQRIDCAGRWISADGTRFGPQINPTHTPRTPHPSFRQKGSQHYGQGTNANTSYSTHNANTPTSVWTPPESYVQSYTQPYTQPYVQPSAPVIVTRGNHTNAYKDTTDIYVNSQLLGDRHETYAPVHQRPCNAPQNVQVYCGGAQTAPLSAPTQGCFTLDEHGQPHAIACPEGGYQTQSSAVYSRAPQAAAFAKATASANVEINNAGFFNTLSGGVGGGGTTFVGGGGGAFVSGGGGSVLSRAPLVRFGSRNRGRKGGKGRKGGGGMGGGGMGGGGMGGCD